MRMQFLIQNKNVYVVWAYLDIGNIILRELG